MSIQSIYVAVPRRRSPTGQKAFSTKEFATLGNFTARSPAASAWGSQIGARNDFARQIVPPAGINIPEKGQ